MKQQKGTVAIAIVVILSALVILLGLVLEIKHSMRMKVYAISHDCSWSYVGVENADDGYICIKIANQGEE